MNSVDTGQNTPKYFQKYLKTQLVWKQTVFYYHVVKYFYKYEIRGHNDYKKIFTWFQLSYKNDGKNIKKIIETFIQKKNEIT